METAFGEVTLSKVFWTALLAYLVYSAAVAYYNAYLHPLAKFPGPKLRAAFYFLEYFEVLKQTTVPATKALHDQYGPVVRLSPEALSFITPQAWKDIYGFRQNKRQIPKDEKRFLGNVPTNIMKSSDADHARIRKLLAHAFSETALREQEPLLQEYFDLLIHQLRREVDGPDKGEVDLVKWMKLITYDIVADLALGESFDALQSGQYHPWMQAFFTSFQMLRFARFGAEYPVPFGLLLKVMSKNPKVAKMRNMIFGFTQGKTEKRLESPTQRKDFISYIQRYNDERGMTKGEILPTAAILVNAGGGTSSDTLSALWYYTLRDPSVRARLEQEVRSAFQSEADINLTSVGQLEYLTAVIEETLRIHPPVAGIFERRTDTASELIDGWEVPYSTSLGVHQWSINHSPDYFHNPESFVPERWLKNPPKEYQNDVQDAMQPFSCGPRNCIGRNLAYFNIRSIVARTVWAFDMSLDEKSRDWDQKPTFSAAWQHPPLYAKLSHRNG